MDKTQGGVKLKKNEENEDLEITPGELEIEQEQKIDNVADALTSEQLDKKVKKLVDEKIELALGALDNEEDEEIEEEEEPKGLGVFPILLIGGVVLVGAATIFLKNRPNSHPNEAENEIQG